MPQRAETTSDPLASTGRYRTARRLGGGGFGEVFEAEDTASGARVCVKLLHPEIARSEKMVDRFRLEAEVLRALSDHPHVLVAHEADRTPEGRLFLVTELLVGRTLLAELEERVRLPMAEALPLALEMLDGLAAAHALGITHRDIKPANLFLVDGPPRRLVILDFGIAKVAADRDHDGGVRPLSNPTTEGSILGTPRYLAPEQALGKKVDARSDLYSCALVIVKMVAGVTPFDHHKKEIDLLTAHLSEVPVPLSMLEPGVPAALDAAIARALEKEPEDRFQDAASFAAALRAVLPGQPAQPEPSPPGPRPRLAAPPTELLPAPRGAQGSAADAPTEALSQLLVPTEPLASPLAPVARALDEATTRPLAGRLVVPLPGPPAPPANGPRAALGPPPEGVDAVPPRRPSPVASLIQLALVGAAIAIVATLLVLYVR